MKLILVGCEYAGTTTLAQAIDSWARVNLGKGFRLIHDHFKLPDTRPHGDPWTDDEIERFDALSPRMKEVAQRHNLYYHTAYGRSSDQTQLTIGLHIDEAVYGPLYYEYGAPGQEGERAVIAKHIDHRIMKYTPETVLVLVTASPETIARRMKEAPHQHQVVREPDIELVLRRFGEEHRSSLIERKIDLDTSETTADEAVADFAEKMEAHFTPSDLTRLLVNRR